MQLTDEERIERGIKKDLQDERIREQRAMKQQVSLVKKEENALKKEENTLSGIGDQKQKRWDIVKRKGTDLTDRNVAGFNPIEINLLDIMYAALEIARANWYDPINPLKIVARYLPGMVELEGSLEVAKKFIIDKYDDQVTRRLLNDSDLPKLTFKAAVNDEGHFTSTISKNNQPAQELKIHLTHGVEAWAQQHGYRLQLEGEHQVFTNAAGERMTKAVFDGLNNNPATGLGSFLTNLFKVEARFDPTAPGEPNDDVPVGPGF